MVGLIPRTLINTVKSLWGEPGLTRLAEATGLDLSRPYKIGSPYTDQEWQVLFDKTLETFAISRKDFIGCFSDEFMRDAIERWPSWFKMAKSSREFLKLQPLIHNSFASGVVDADARRSVEDKFRLEEQGDLILVNYRSPNNLCDLYIALAERLAAHYGDHVHIENRRCTMNGDPKCQIAVAFLEAERV